MSVCRLCRPTSPPRGASSRPGNGCVLLISGSPQRPPFTVRHPGRFPTNAGYRGPCTNMPGLFMSGWISRIVGRPRRDEVVRSEPSACEEEEEEGNSTVKYIVAAYSEEHKLDRKYFLALQVATLWPSSQAVSLSI